jgi:NitT/TauT family transport system substrate-binding protein
MNLRILSKWVVFLRDARLLVAGLLLVLPGCGGSSPSNTNKLRVAYLGLTCEAPIFVAYEKGFFQEEGLDVELVKTDWNGLREGLSLGTFDANHTLAMYLLKPIEQGADIKITGGIHTGCLRVQVASNSPINDIKALKGKRIGVPTHIGSPPYLFACRVLSASGIKPNPEHKEIEWLPYPPDVLAKALQSGQVDAVATSDPIGTILVGKGLVRTIADQAVDPPYNDEYCCVAVVSGKLARGNPQVAAKVTRALLKAAKWVSINPQAAGRLSVEKGYTASTVEINVQAISKLNYTPGVNKCRNSLTRIAQEMKEAGLLNAPTDPAELARRAWLDLEGVSDAWINSLRLAQIPGGGRPALLSPQAFAALFEGRAPCCACCCLTD